MRKSKSPGEPLLAHPRQIILAAIALVGVGMAACDPAGRGDAGTSTDAATPVTFDAGTVRIATSGETFQLRAEIAERPEQRTHGLMERQQLADDAGMIFLFERQQDASGGFWMFRTRIPLDIAFLNEDGEIVAVLGMEPCDSPNPSTCRRYSPGVPYHAALEVNRGYFQRHGIGPGDRVVLVRSTGESWP